ncbi:Bug family tripartite tricarboxylate transporter substrate binding protein [Muricoccus radiodurans]|uniref:Bug family tripartite tricarboxylate transporter substrate binding protein n=1 Tax=Muricoccus radiodurans TaxID=2231721 RepID=UPI003CF454AB
MKDTRMPGVGRRWLLAAPFLLPALGRSVGAQGLPAGYPNRPIRLIVPFAAGGSGDIVLRMIAPRLSERIGQTVVIENRDGAGGVVGVDAVAKAAPDGYTIGFGTTGPLATSVTTQPNMPYHPLRDLAPITVMATVAELLVVSPRLGVTNMQELLALARARPGTLNFGSSGPGALPHLAGEMLKTHARINITHVPYRGVAPAVNDVLAGQIEMMFADLPVLLPHVRAGTVRAIAVASPARSPLLPDVPTMTEVGLPAVEAENWYAIVAPARTPPAILDFLQARFGETVRIPEVTAALIAQGLVPVGSERATLGRLLETEIPKWAELARATGAAAQ